MATKVVRAGGLHADPNGDTAWCQAEQMRQSGVQSCGPVVAPKVAGPV